MYKLLSFLFLISTANFYFAQQTEFDVRKKVNTATEDELVKENSRMLQENYFFFAEIVSDRLLQIKPESANYNYRKGFIILDSRQDWISAMPYLLKAVTDLDKNFDAYSASEKSAPTDALYHLARCYHYDAQIDKAREYYKRFLSESSTASELIEKAKLRLIQCNVAEKLIETPRSVKVVNIGDKINTNNPEYAPVVSFDGSAIYFTSRRQWEDNSTDEFRDPRLNQFPEDIYVSYIDQESNEWKKPERLPICEGNLNEASITLSADERRIYTYEDRTGNGDIYFADFRMNKFRDLAILPYNKFNTQYWETHCTVTPDGLQIYFVSDRPGGFGGRDIYRMVKLPTGDWSDPVNLGPTINTSYDEDSPFIAIDNKTLYYSSNGPQSMGEFDIFMSVRDKENNWSTPLNLGYPINSTGDDVFYTTTADGSKGYLSSFRRDGKGEKDIYEIQHKSKKVDDLVILKATLRSSEGLPIPERICAVVKCTNCDFVDEKLLKPRVRDGVILSQMSPCREYEIAYKLDASADAIYTTSFRTECKPGYQEVLIDLVLDTEQNIIVRDLKYTLDGKVSDTKTQAMLDGASLTFKDTKTGKILETVKTNKDGEFISNVLKDAFPGKKIKYEVTISKEKYITQTFEWNINLDTLLDKHLSYQIEMIDIGLDLARIFNLKPIYFDLNKWNIRADAKIELNKIVKALNDNPTVEIELGSHTDCRSSKSYNIKLSDKRAKSSAAYIKSRITNPSRIYGKGYGESMLVNGCECEGTIKSTCTEAEHQANRRTEFKIVKY
jgi:outer membrane protein OmpA-like peptidoglycan-associated protein